MRDLGGRCLALVLLAFGCSGTPVVQGTAGGGTLRFQGESIDYLVHVPPARSPDQPLPALLLLHGAGGTGSQMLPLWRSLADANGLVLIAPTLSLTAAQETKVPELLPALLDAAGAGLNLDPKRTYAFGYSAGGYFAFDAATLLSTRFAAVAVFASVIAPEYDSIVKQAVRKTPVAIYIGDADPYFSLAQTRRTRDLLVSNGFPVRYVEIERQDHAYSRIAEQINRDAWTFFSASSLGTP